MIVYAVIFSNYEPAEIAALYDNPGAAADHAAALNEKYDAGGWRVTPWTVASKFDRTDTP